MMNIFKFKHERNFLYFFCLMFKLTTLSFKLAIAYFAFPRALSFAPLSHRSLLNQSRNCRMSSSEVDAAKIAASTDPAINPNAPTFFDKLVKKEIPSTVIYEDDLCMAFRDINPQVFYRQPKYL